MRTIVFPDREVGRVVALGEDGFIGRELGIARRTSLRALSLGKTKISPDGFFVLRAALPHCDVHGP